jgi:hypothetical protein
LGFLFRQNSTNPPVTLEIGHMAGSTQADLQEQLRRQFVGKNLQEISVPAAILDVNKVKRNCVRMLQAVDALQFGWRAHIKTHKVNNFRCSGLMSEILYNLYLIMALLMTVKDN